MNDVRRDQLPYPNLAEAEGDAQPRPETTAEGASVVDRHSHFNGVFRSDSDLRIEGSLEGEIECDGTVTVVQDASLSATVYARNMVVAGVAEGEIKCQERLTIQSTGEMRGKAQAATLVVEEGAFFEGEFRMGEGEAFDQGMDFGSWSTSRTFESGSGDSNPSEQSQEGRDAYATSETSSEDDEGEQSSGGDWRDESFGSSWS